MGDYSDYVITTPHNKWTVAGICHTRGDSQKMPERLEPLI